ncbi:hypothetical protein BHE74_00043164 [Ensete ventricosum]|nr:hypothetical protein BHE74_00043164 [Ensete ventricosum]
MVSPQAMVVPSLLRFSKLSVIVPLVPVVVSLKIDSGHRLALSEEGSGVDVVIEEEVVVVFLLTEDADNKEGQWWQQGDVVAARRCSGRGAVESGCGSEGSSGKGGGSGVVRSTDSIVRKSGKRRPIDGERRVAARMVGGDEGGRQQRRLGATGDNDRGLAGGDSGRGWATAAEGWPMVDEERKKGRDAEDNSRADGGEEATAGGHGEDSDDRREEAAGASAFGVAAVRGVVVVAREEKAKEVEEEDDCSADEGFGLRMVSRDEGGRQQRCLGAIGDSDRGLAGGDNGRGWATIAEGWPMVDEERKKGRDAKDNSRADDGEEAAVGG